MVFDPVPVRPGHDSSCEVGRGTVLEECWCASRAWYANERVELVPVEVPWGLFGFERGRPDTRGHDRG